MLFTITTLFLLAVPCISWTTPAYMNLIYPPPWTTGLGDGYVIKNGTKPDPFTLDQITCLNRATPSNVTRTLFPITGGSLKFGFVNNSADWPDENGPDKFWIDMYISDGNAPTAPYSSNSFFRYGGLKRMQFWQNFQTGMTCSVPLEQVLKSRLRQPENATAISMLEGLNLTFGLVIMDSRGPRFGEENWSGKVFEEVHQCAYVTLTSKSLTERDSNDEMCNRVNLDYFGTSTRSALPTATSSAAAEAFAHFNVGAAIVLTFLGMQL